MAGDGKRFEPLEREREACPARKFGQRAGVLPETYGTCGRAHGGSGVSAANRGGMGIRAQGGAENGVFVLR